MNPDYLKFARAVLRYFAETGFASWHEYNVHRRAGRDGHRRSYAYHCEDCGLFHIASVKSAVNGGRITALRRYGEKMRDLLEQELASDA